MELDDYFSDFSNAVVATAESGRNYSVNAFLEVAAERLAEAQEVLDLAPSHFEGVGSKGRLLRLDGYVVDEADGSVVLLVGDYRQDAAVQRLTTTEAKRLFQGGQAFVEDAISGKLAASLEPSSEAYATAKALARLLPTATRIRFYLVTNAVMSERIKDFPPSKLGRIDVTFHIWDLARFLQAHLAVNGREDIVVGLDEWIPGGLQVLQGGTTTEGFRTFLAVLPGSVLAAVFGRYGSRLLEGNVRSFLSARTKPNRDMRATLAQDPHFFLAYNNGLTTTASSIETVEANGVIRITSITDLQIVNGGQTTASLASYLREGGNRDLDGVFVQMKLVVVNPDGYETLVPNIAQYANSQNRVNEADFFANSPYHRRLEDISRRILAPAKAGSQLETRWFYERARGQFLNEKSRRSAADRKKFELQHPQAQVLKKTDVSKFEFSWSERPHDVSLGTQKNFIKFAETAKQLWDTRPDDVNELYFKSLVAKSILFSSTRRRISEQDWYQAGGYLANLTTYSVAKLAHLVRTQSGGAALNLGAVWSAQSVTPATLKQVDQIALAVNGVLNSSKRGSQNVSEWAKKPECWAQVQAAEVALIDEFAEELVPTQDQQLARQESRKTQKVDTGIEGQIRVMKVSSTTWREIRDAPELSSVLSPQDIAALRLVTGEVTGSVPEGFQVKRLLGVLAKAASFGVISRS